MADAVLDQMLEAGFGRAALLIAGPTASGKSALAIAAARRLGGVVVNADSMQIYDGLRVLTARPTPDEERQAEHRLYGVVDPRIAFSAGAYIRLAGPILSGIRAAGKVAIIVGGTGLYFRALTQGLVETPEIPPHVVSQVAQVESQGSLHSWLAQRDPARAAELDPADAPRLQRAAAVWLATGRGMKEWQAEAQPPLLVAGSWTGVFLDADRSALYERIDQRFRRMIAGGALDEVRSIMALELPANRGVMKAHGMPHLVRHARGEISLDAAVSEGQRDTRNYAKRQLTWARRYMADWLRIPV
jgi:tRNA dimethylallyltransferase